MNNSKIEVCIVAILKDEQPYLDEWIIYHRILGINHFYLYDNDPLLPLEKFLEPHKSYVTVIPWSTVPFELGKGTNQIQAYKHALDNLLPKDNWVAFLDADEFIVLKKHSNISDFLSQFSQPSVSLNWHVFGHSGYFDDPKGLITSSLLRRKREPSINVKSITKVDAIRKILSPHICELLYGKRMDANNKFFTPDLYENKTVNAHINHYQCRSFSTWMRRADRGDVNFSLESCPPQHEWRLSKEKCLKQFVTTVALDKNEHWDDSMLVFKKAISSRLVKISRHNNLFHEEYRLYFDKQKTAIEKQLVSIATFIKNNLSETKEIGLLGGKSGAALFFFYYGDYSKNELYSELATLIMNNLSEEIDDTASTDYASGLAGFGALLEFLTQKGLFEIDTDEALSNLDEYLSGHIRPGSFKSVNLFTGVTGIGRYFYSRLKSPFSDNESICKINSDAISKIIALLQAPYNTYFDLLSVIDFLSCAYPYIQEKARALHYLNYAVDKLETMVYEDSYFEDSDSLFNPLSTAWCLIKASERLENPVFLNMANEYLRKYEAEYYKKKIENGTVHMSDWLLYYQLFNYYRTPYYSKRAFNCFEIFVEATTRYLKKHEDAPSESFKVKDFWVLGMSLLTAVHARGGDWLELILPCDN